MTKGLNFDLIEKAVSGDETAINKIVAIYEPYINTLSSQSLYDMKSEIRNNVCDICRHYFLFN